MDHKPLFYSQEHPTIFSPHPPRRTHTMPRQQRRVTTTQTIGAEPVLFTICYHHTGVKPHPFISPPPDSVERVRAAGCLGA